MKRWVIIATAWLLSMTPLVAQQTFQAQTGIGLPELLHGGVMYYWEAHAIGVTVGTLPDQGSTMLSISPVYRYHFGRAGRLGPVPKWYFQMGAHYLRDYNHRRVITDILLSPRIGRDFMVSYNSGLSLNIGFSLEAYHDRRYVEPYTGGWFNSDIHFPILPNAGVSVFYRF